MKSAKKTEFTSSGREIFEKIAAIWPPIIKDQKSREIDTMISLLMNSRKVKKADPALVIEAARKVVPKSYDPLFHMMEDMQKFKRVVYDKFTDMATYNRIPVQVRRWKRPHHRKATQGNSKTITAFCASPRPGGNTDLLIEEALRGARSEGARTEKIMLQKLKMQYCIGCRKCKEPDYAEVCAVHDEMTETYQKIIDSSAIVIGFPIYTGRESAQLCTFLDRWDGFERFLFQGILKPGRHAMVIGTWGYSYIDTYDQVIEKIITILQLHKVETVEALSACGFEGVLHGLDERRQGILLQHPKQLKKAFDAGKALARYA